MKRLLALLLVAACVLALSSSAFAYSSFDEFMAAQGRLPGIEYGRIRQDTQRAIKLSFEIGTKSFRGVLARGKKLDDARTDEIIKETMRFHDLTTAKMYGLRSDIAAAKAQRQPFDADFWLEAAGELLHVNNLVKAVDAYQGKMTGADYCVQYIQSKPVDMMIDAGVSALGLTGLPALIATGLVGAGNSTLREFVYLGQYSETNQKALDAALKLDQFYADCNALIQKESDRQDYKWRLTAYQAPDKEDRVLFGANVKQLWSFSCSLEKESGGNGADEYWGDYVGVMTVDISHDMHDFDTNFLWNVADQLPVLPQLRDRNPMHSFYDSCSAPTTLTKSLAAAQIRLYIPPNAKDAKKDSLIASIDLSQFRTKSGFWCYHTIWMVPDGVVPFLDNEGKYQFDASSAHLEGQMGTEIFLMGQMPDGLCPELFVKASRMHLWDDVTAPRTHQHRDGGIVNEGDTMRTNTDIFRDLESGKILVRAGWKGDQS